MWPDWVSNLGPLAHESDALPTALRGPAPILKGGDKLFSNSADPDQTEQSDLGLHCCLKHFCPNVSSTHSISA